MGTMESEKPARGLEPIHTSPSKTKGRARSARSAVTNGMRAYVVGNGSSPWARRQRDLLDRYLSDQGGIDHVSAVTYARCEIAAFLGVERELFAGQRSLGQEIDLDKVGRLVGHERRVLQDLGSERVQRPVEDLAAYLVEPKGDE